MPFEEEPTDALRTRFDPTAQSLECQLRFAAKYGSFDSIYSLVTFSNADINSPDHNGYTPLVISILHGNQEICDLLCELGADINYTAEKLHGYSALHFAAEANQAGTIEVLSEYGAQRNPQTFTGCTPLHLAAMNGNVEAVRILCLNGADVNIPEWYNGYTPLNYAVTRGHMAVVNLLLEFNASLVLVYGWGESGKWTYVDCLQTEPRVLEQICLDVIRKHYLWPNANKNVSRLPLPTNIKKKILLEHHKRH